VSAVESVTIVGPGRMGLALGAALVHTDAVGRLVVCGRRPEPPSHPLFTQGVARYVFGFEPLGVGTAAVFLAVPDVALPEVAHTLAAQGDAPDGAAAFHMSGAMSTDVMAPLHARGYEVGSFFPLQPVVHAVTAAERLPGSHIAVTAGPGALGVARRLASAMGSPVLTVPESWRAQFHAAVVLSSNALAPLLDAACRALERAGVPHDESLAALLPLVRGGLANIEEMGLYRSVAGPIANGDLEAVGLHLRALEGHDRTLYAVLGRALVRMIEDELDEATAMELKQRFEHELGE
jgi:predicted short-subunit dehydrogenase-like oxidoreductase (DUF2520 family)